MLRQTISKHYKVIFRSKLLYGAVVFLLFLTGLARYRAALVFSIAGFLSAVNQYYLEQETNTKFPSYYERIRQGFIPAILIALYFDGYYGQMFPVFPDLPLWSTILSLVAGYAVSRLLYSKAGRLVRWSSGDKVFVVCPSCSFDNKKAVETCNHCGFTKDMPEKNNAAEH